MWDNKDQIRETGKLMEPSQAGGFLEKLIWEVGKAGTKGAVNLGRMGAAKAVKSDYAKKKIKDVANKYLDQALDSLTLPWCQRFFSRWGRQN